MSERPLTILFMPESVYGPPKNCIGIGDALRRRGHRGGVRGRGVLAGAP